MTDKEHDDSGEEDDGEVALLVLLPQPALPEQKRFMSSLGILSTHVIMKQ